MSLIWAGCLAVSLAGIVQDPQSERTAEAPILASRPTAAVQAVNRFGLSLLQAVYQKSPGRNFIFSPVSVGSTLGMLQMGAAGKTKAEMIKVLGFNFNREESWRTYFRLEESPADGFVQRSSLWTLMGLQLRPEFVQYLAEEYQAEARSVDFGDPQALEQINRWASDATKGRVNRILDKLSPETQLLILNAVAFEAQWVAPFNPKSTAPGRFAAFSGPRDTMMMHRPAAPSWLAEYDGFRVLGMPYRGDRFAMLLILPDGGSDVAEALSLLAAADWSGLLAGLSSSKVGVSMPRFRSESSLFLNPFLSGMGMPSAFSATRADFSGMRKENDLVLERMLHRALIQVDEMGTVAAAGTVAIATPRSISPRFVVDRPFLFAIIDRATGAHLFLGIIGEPRG